MKKLITSLFAVSLIPLFTNHQKLNAQGVYNLDLVITPYKSSLDKCASKVSKIISQNGYQVNLGNKTKDWIKIFGIDISQSTSIHVECDTNLGVKSVAISYPNGVDFIRINEVLEELSY